MKSTESIKPAGTDIIPESKIKITTWLTYIAAVFGGAIYPISGLLSPQVAEHFGVMTEKIVFIDSLTLFGLIVGNLISGKIIEKIGGKKTLALAAVIFAATQCGIALQNHLFIYAFLDFMTGIAMGFYVPSVSYLIVAAYDKVNKSDAKLNILNFFFGIGGFFGPSIGGILAKNYSWRTAYFICGLTLLIIFIIAYLIKVNEKTSILNNQLSTDNLDKTAKKKVKAINFAVILVGLSLIAYVYTEYVIIYWFSPYLQESFNYNVDTVGFVIGGYWLSVAIGRFLFGEFIIPKVKDYKFIIFCAVIVALAFFIFIGTSNHAVVFILIIVLGLGCASIFPTLLGYGMKQTRTVSPITMSFLVCSGSIGGALSLLSSATIGSHLPKVYAIYMGPVCCALIIIFVICSRIHKNSKIEKEGRLIK